MRNIAQMAFVILSLTIFSPQYVQAQSWAWAKRHYHSVGNTNACVWPQDLCIDASDNIVTTGYYAGESVDAVSFDGISANGYGTGAFHYTGYVCKHNSAGVVQWAQRFGSGGTNQNGGVQGVCVSTDAAGNVYVGGNFSRDCRFGGSLTTNTGGTVISSVYGDDGFIIKYSSAGVFQWVKHIKSSSTAPQGSECVRGIDVTASGIYVTGTFSGRTDFGGTFLTSTLDGASYSTDVFVAKYDLSGNLVWVQQVVGNKTDYSTGISADAADNFYVFGEFQSTATFGSYSITSGGGAGSTITNPFLAKYNNAGVCQWVRSGYSTSSISNYYLTTQPPAVDINNNIYISGSIPAGASINWGSVQSNGSGFSTIYCTKFNASGTHQWSQQFTSTGDIFSGTVSAIGGSTLNIAGNFVGTANFGGYPQTATASSSVFVLRLSQSAGTPVFSKKATGTSLTAYVPSLGTLSNGELIVGGLVWSVSNPMVFDSYSITLERSTGYVAKLAYNNLPVELIDFSYSCIDEGIQFNWSTASESNSRDFTLSIREGDNWKPLATIPAAGNSNILQEYSFVCSEYSEGENYFKLTQSDLDGTENLLGFIAVGCKNESSVSVYPNPAQNELHFNTIGDNSEVNNIEITDVQGKIVMTRNIYIENGEGIDISHLTAGVYFIKFTLLGEIKSFMFIKE